jgi:PAS domain S-box-containing protein
MRPIRSSSKILDLLQGLTRDVRCSRNLRHLLDNMLTTIMGLIGAQRGDFALWNDARQDLVIEATYGPRTPKTLKVGHTVPPVSFMNDLWKDPARSYSISGDVRNRRHPYYMSNEKTKSEIAVRFQFEGTPGILNAESFKRDAFDLADSEFLALVSPCAAAASRLAKEEDRLWDNVGHVLKYSASLHRILSAILESLYELHQLFGLIYIADDEAGQLRAVEVFAEPAVKDRAKGFRYKYNEPAAAVIVRTNRRPMFIKNPPTDPRVNHEGRERFGITGPMVLLPLPYGKAAVGVLVAWANAEPLATAAHVQRLKPFARLAAAKIAMWRAEQQHRRTEKELRDSENFYHSLVQSIPQCILRKDLKERFTFANNGFCQMLGKSLKEIRGKTDFDFYPPELAEKYQRDDRNVINTGQTFQTVEENQTPNGEKLYVHVVKTPIFDADNKVIGIQGIFRDITPERKTQEDLEEYGERTFHCLKGPLFLLERSLQCASDLETWYDKQRNTAPKAFDELLSLLRQSCGAFDFYLKNLKKFLDAELVLRPHSIARILKDEVWYLAKSARRELQPRLTTTLPENLMIPVDVPFFVAAVKELFQNAWNSIYRKREYYESSGLPIKRGRIIIGIRLVPGDDKISQEHLRMSILDTGDTSFDAQAFAKLDKYWNGVVHKARQPRYQKGLSFVNWVIEKHQGYWKLEKYQRGVGFHIHLPLCEPL